MPVSRLYRHRRRHVGGGRVQHRRQREAGELAEALRDLKHLVDLQSVSNVLGGAWPEHWIDNESEMLVEVNARRAQGAIF